ncbi:MAG: Xylose isomerase domain protein barrel [Paenibacillaceae bacterium]|jgi:sugar phosphate isomerase/epimerase|nr:Xylose isomerase domain protein barrel [Paenibacillaceae bacterium]
MNNKLAFSRPTSNDDEKSELFNNYRLVGYDGLQLKLAQYKSYLKEPEKFIADYGHLSGIGSGLIIGGKLDEGGKENLRNAFRFAQRIHSEIIVFCLAHPRDKVTTEEIRRYADNLSELGQEARQYGVQLSLHHHYNQPVMYRTDFDIFFERVRPESLGLTVDTAHLVKSGIHDIAEIIRTFGRFINNFHLKDFSDGNWKVLGQGTIDFEPIFKAIKETDYRGWISADEESGGTIQASMQECLTFINKGLA